MCAECGCTPVAEHGPAKSLDASSIDEGELARLEVDGTVVAVANVGGEFYAFSDTCTHEACPLSDGDLDGNVVTCPCHGSMFDVTTGSVVNGPATEPVATYKVTVEGDTLRVQV